MEKNLFEGIGRNGTLNLSGLYYLILQKIIKVAN
jgi:hypothetical protein